MENKPGQTLKIAIISVVALALAALLVKALLTYAQISLSELLGDVKNLPIWLLIVTTAGMLFNIMLGAQNWRLAVERVAPSSRQSYLFYLTYSALSAGLGLFIPIQLSNLIIRSLSLKLWGNASVQKSTVTALVSQIHDVTVSAAFLLPGIMVVFWKTVAYQWLAYEIVLVTGLYFLLSRYTFAVVQSISAWNIKIKAVQKILNVLKEGVNAGLFDNDLMARLYRNSLVKFVILAARVYLITIALGLGLSFAQIAGIFSALQLSIIFTVTPGNLGVVEWGWVGLLMQTGISAYDAGHFALVTRALGYTNTTAVVTGILLFFITRKGEKKAATRRS